MVKLAHKKTSLYFETDLVYKGLPDMGSFNDNYSTYFKDLISEISEECEHRSVGHVSREVYHVITAREFDLLKRIELHNVIVDLPEIVSISVREEKVISEMADFIIKDIVVHLLTSKQIKIIMNIIFMEE